MTEYDLIIGGEESGGLTVHGHVPEKDGILACMLMAELRAKVKKSFKKIIADLQKKVGFFYTNRVNISLNEKIIEQFRERMNSKPPVKISGFTTVRINDMDGWKYIFKENAWMGIRLSGTEPVARLYLEADSPKKISSLLAVGKKLIKG